MKYENTIRGKKYRTLNKIHKCFIYDKVIPYLVDDLGFVKVKKFPGSSRNTGAGKFYFYKKDNIVILLSKIRYNRVAYAIVVQINSSGYEIIGTIGYEMVYPDYHRWMFIADLFEILNKDYYGTIEFIGIEDYFKAEGREYYFPPLTKIFRGDNPVSRRILKV